MVKNIKMPFMAHELNVNLIKAILIAFGFAHKTIFFMQAHLSIV
jgi:hypothetical protein